MNILSEQLIMSENKSGYTYLVVFHNGKPETVHRKMSATWHHFKGWPTHMVDGHSFYVMADWSWRLGSLDIILENQRLYICCDENLDEYVTDIANLMSHIDIILKHMRIADHNLHE